MSSIGASQIQELRDRAVIARRISAILSDNEAAKSLEKHAQDLDAQVMELEKKISRLGHS